MIIIVSTLGPSHPRDQPRLAASPPCALCLPKLRHSLISVGRSRLLTSQAFLPRASPSATWLSLEKFRSRGPHNLDLMATYTISYTTLPAGVIVNAAIVPASWRVRRLQELDQNAKLQIPILRKKQQHQTLLQQQPQQIRIKN